MSCFSFCKLDLNTRQTRRKVLYRNVVKKSCGEAMSRSVVLEMCCEDVLWRSVTEKCWEGVLWSSVVEKRRQEMKELCGAVL